MFQAAYTFGSTLDYGSSFEGLAITVPQKLATAVVWEIPGPKQGWMKGVLGGWQLSETTILQSGSPFSVNGATAFTPVRAGAVITGNSGCDYNADGNNNDRPDAPGVPKTIDYSRDACSPA